MEITKKKLEEIKNACREEERERIEFEIENTFMDTQNVYGKAVVERFKDVVYKVCAKKKGK